MNAAFKAMSDSSRRLILQALRDRPLTAGEIAETVGLTPSALSFHLAILKNADLVSDVRKGQFIEYTLNTSVVDDLIRFMLQHFGGSVNTRPVSAKAKKAGRRPGRKGREVTA